MAIRAILKYGAFLAPGGTSADTLVFGARDVNAAEQSVESLSHPERLSGVYRCAR